MFLNLCKKLAMHRNIITRRINKINLKFLSYLINFYEEALLLLVLDRHRDQNLEVFLKCNLSDNLSVKISLTLVFDNIKVFII